MEISPLVGAVKNPAAWICYQVSCATKTFETIMLEELQQQSRAEQAAYVEYSVQAIPVGNWMDFDRKPYEIEFEASYR